MRKIKFRAWDNQSKEMILSSPYSFVAFDGSIGEGYPHDLDCQPMMKSVDYLELMQYAGIKDKNGKEIYEGDILSIIEKPVNGKQTSFGIVEVKFGEYDDSDIDSGSLGIGWFVKGYHGYRRGNREIDKYFIGSNGEPEWSLKCCGDWEVIGNIYENPELMEVGDGIQRIQE
jgi:uncharacterized phage protein (TIGR01671 family)